jgi:sigma-B regulation protein RsbU (phosphoserine phosphatase)
VLKNRGLAFKLVLFFTLSTVAIFAAIFGYSYYLSRRMIESNVEERARNVVTSIANRIETELQKTEKIAKGLAVFLEEGQYDEKELMGLLRRSVDANPEIYGSAIAFEPFAFKKKEEYFAPYIYREYGILQFKYLDRHYNYFSWDWYQIPKELGTPQWSEPYMDEGGGGVIMSTYSVPFYKGAGDERKLAGIVTADLSLNWLQEIVSSIKVLETGYGFVISKNGTLVTHPMKELIMNETLFGVAEARGDAFFRHVGRMMLWGNSGLVSYVSVKGNKLSWLYFVPIKSAGWSLGVIFPKDEYMADIRRLSVIGSLLFLLGICILSGVIIYIARRITKPLRDMTEATVEIGAGNLERELPVVETGDEVGRLATAFESMRTSLKDYIRELTATTAAKERIENELKIAHDIQMSILPKIFPPFPDRHEFDIYATIQPAREVGGDFYDFFETDYNHLCFVIADVSDKGIPASLFMAVTKTLIKSKATVQSTPDDIVSAVNEDLCTENETGMFVTLFCGILDTRSGEILYTNGGHNPPVVMRKNGQLEFLKGARSLVVGAMEGAPYSTERLVLEPGDAIFLYTDGVTEAMDPENLAFGEERLLKSLENCREAPVEEMIRFMMDDISQFVRGAHQSDDITMLVIRYDGLQKNDGEISGGGMS